MLLDFALSTGSACNSRSAEPSYVLRAMGRSTEEAQASLRFSFGHASTGADIDAVVAAIRERHAWLWGMSPARPVPVFRDVICTVRYVGEAGAEQLGTWVRFALQVDAGWIRKAEVQVYGCPETLAASNYVCGRLMNEPVANPSLGTPEEWRRAVKAPVEKLGKMLIIEDAVRALAPA
jgi:cysteine desulfurase